MGEGLFGVGVGCEGGLESGSGGGVLAMMGCPVGVSCFSEGGWGMTISRYDCFVNAAA